MDLISAIIIILFIIFIVRGAWRGFAGELAHLIGIIVCLSTLWYGYYPAQRLIAHHFPTLTANACVFYSAIAIAVCGSVGFILASLLVRKIVNCILPQPFNAILGALVGGAKVFLFVSLIGSLVTMGKNKLQALQDESQRNPFLSTATQFWIAQIRAIDLRQLISTDDSVTPPAPQPESPAPQKGAD